MRLFATLLMLSLVFACSYAPGTNASSEFLQEIDDVPIPDGFAQQGDEPLVYDTPAGRIVEATIEGEAKQADISKFYEDTLPQLGWKKESGEAKKLSFVKEDEKLDMEFIPLKPKLQVKFSLYPAK